MRLAKEMRLPDLEALNCARFRWVGRGAIVPVVRASGAMRARLVVAILSLALVYAFTCSATCANCLDAGATAATETHGCGHAAPDAPGGAQQQAPAKPDCSGHHHSGFEAVQTDRLSQIELAATGGASQLFVGAVSSDVVNVASSFLSDLAPPQDSTIAPQRKISVLRI
jgi:hypothetical protein